MLDYFSGIRIKNFEGAYHHKVLLVSVVGLVMFEILMVAMVGLVVVRRQTKARAANALDA